MTIAAAITQLLALSVTGVKSNVAVGGRPPETPDLPALRLDNISQPFSEGLQAWNVAADKGTVTVFYDHKLLIGGARMGFVTDRWDDRVEYVDKYLSALVGDLTLNDNLVEPLRLVVLQQDEIQLSKRYYNGIVFRHMWKIRIA
jgi:hypothetical protein